MASLSTCHLGLWLGWQILLNSSMVWDCFSGHSDGGRAEEAHLDPCESFRLGASIAFIGVFGHGYESQSVASDRFGFLVCHHHMLYFLVCKFPCRR